MRAALKQRGFVVARGFVVPLVVICPSSTQFPILGLLKRLADLLSRVPRAKEKAGLKPCLFNQPHQNEIFNANWT
jgi:hypothetical protein